MKKKLLLLLCTLLTSVGVWAQIDVTSKYLTNPSFETGDMTGWTSYGYNPEGGVGVVDVEGKSVPVADYPLSNSDGTYICDFYKGVWTGWWSYYTLSQDAKVLPAGDYRLTAVLSSYKDRKVSLYATTSAITTSTGSAQIATFTIDADNEGKTATLDFTSDGSTPVILGAGLITNGSSNGYPSFWQVFFKADNFKLYRLASDMSGKMNNNVDSWTGGTGRQVNKGTYNGGVETYQGNTSPFSVGDVLYQTITDSPNGLPNGIYEVSFYAWENYADHEETENVKYGDGYAQAFANGSVYNLNSIKNKNGRDFNPANLYTLKCYVTDGTLKYGVKNVREGGNWVVCKANSLKYYGADVIDYTSLISNANFEGTYAAMSNSGRGDDTRELYIPQGWTLTYTDANGWAGSALKSGDKFWDDYFSSKPQPTDGGHNVYWTRLRDNNTSLTLSQKVALPSGYYTLNAEGYNESSANGTARLSVKVGTTTYSNNFIDGSWNHRQVPFYLSGVSGAQEIEITYSVSSTNGEVIAGVDNLTLTRLSDNVFTTGDDVTNLILSPNCNTNTEWAGGASGGRTMDNMEAYDGETRDVFSSSVYYDISSKNGQRHQSISLPLSGTYKLTTYCKVPGTNNNGFTQIWVDALGNYIDHTNARHLYTVNNSGSKTGDINYNGEGWYANEIYFTADAGESKTIYINLSRGNGSGNTEYAYVSGMKLTYLGTTPEISFDEAIVNPVVEVAHANVTIARNMKSDRWNTFTVPFDMAIPVGWTVKELTGVDYNESTSNYSLNFEDASSIVAGKAYMVKPESNVIEVSADDVTINTSKVERSEVSDEGYTANFVGNNSYMASAPTGSYIISNNVFYCVNSPVVQKGFRAYITVGGPSPSSARSTVSYDTEGGVTDIQNVVVEGLEESDALKDGKYFENNKIVIVKNGIKYGSNGQKLN